MALRLQKLPEQFQSPLEVKRRGSILILALWAICFLSVLAVTLGVGVRQEVSLVQRLDERGRLRFISEMGVQKAIDEIKKTVAKNYDSFGDTFANNFLVFNDVDMDKSDLSVGYDFLDDLSGKTSFRHSMIDEKGKININFAGIDTMQRLFQIVLGLDEMRAKEIAASIIDWRDSDGELTIPFGSAEDFYYRNLQFPYKVKDGPFEVLEEVLLVKGMDEDAFNKINEYITIYGDGKININTASKPVLLALGLDLDVVNKILLYRYGKDGILDTADDNIFDMPPNIVPKLSQFISLSDSEVGQLSRFVDFFVCDSGFFTVESSTHLLNHRYVARTVGVINREGTILSWREY
jgi:type II secretory pathway component PulK